ncbi:MAG: amidohydrolase family protein [Sphingomonadaceae bacterium]|nr:amidohydrolase family protein [Sphingomonadaceae bacterium]
MANLLLKLLLATSFCVASSSAAHSQDPIALVNANVIDGRGQQVRPGQTITIVDGRIAAIYSGLERELPDGARTIDLGGQTVIPGLIDGHVHFTSDRDGAVDGLREMLRAGITTVRDLAGDSRIAQTLAAQAESHPNTMPNIIYSAVFNGPQFLSDPRSVISSVGREPGSAPWSRFVTESSEISLVVSDARDFGATGLKLYSSLSPDLLQRLVTEARAQGMRSWVHSVVFPSTATDVVAAAPDEIIHAKGFISAGRSDLPDNFTDGIPGWVRVQDYENTDPDGPRFRELFERMAENGTILQPSLVADGDRRPGALPDWVANMRAWACRLTAAAHAAGVTISAGTDTVNFAQGVYLPMELERLVECGLSPIDALQAATFNNALAMGLENEIGSIEVGKRADLVVLSHDPSANIENVRNVVMVFQSGHEVVNPLPTVPGSERSLLPN